MNTHEIIEVSYGRGFLTILKEENKITLLYRSEDSYFHDKTNETMTRDFIQCFLNSLESKENKE